MNIRITPEIDYPESDGKPMAETPTHMLVMWNLIQTLMRDNLVDQTKPVVEDGTPPRRRGGRGGPPGNPGRRWNTPASAGRTKTQLRRPR